jgi:hypothetical protein
MSNILYCNNCGKSNPEDSKFCEYCGVKISNENDIQEKKTNKSKRLLSLIWKIPLGIIAFCIIAFMLLYTFSSSFRTGLNNGSSGNSTKPTSASNTPNSGTSSQNNIDNSQSVVSITCDNNEGGSGTIFTEDGFILTNNHVITEASYCLVTLPDIKTGEPNSIYEAKPIIIPTLSNQYDIAFLQINSAYTDKNGKTWGTYPTNFPEYTSPNGCNNYAPKLGDSLRIYGYPVTSGGYNLTITDGIISSFDDYNDILTSAKVDSGNSGGLAVNTNGCFLGIPSYVESGNYQNLGVIIPSSIIADFVNKDTSLTPLVNEAPSNTAQTVDFSCLKLKNEKMFPNSYYNSNPTYTATLYNGCSKTFKNIGIEVDFYAANAGTTTTPSDTEYVNSGVTNLAPGKSYTINNTVVTPFDTSPKNFTWATQIYRADPN